MSTATTNPTKPPKLPPPWFIHTFWRLHRAAYRLSRGRFLWTTASKRGWGSLHLTATGRRSGRERGVILGYIDDGPNLVTLAMNGWDARSLDGAWSTVVLLAAALGFGLAIAPVNAVLLAVTGSDVHGSASALSVVARTVGMLVGLSLLTAVALRRFTAEVAAIGTPFELCPRTPADCPAYDAATQAAVLTQLHTVFAGAAVAAGLAAVAALVLLRTERSGH